MHSKTIIECHKGPKSPFSLGSLKVWGCSRYEVENVPGPIVLQISLDSYSPCLSIGVSEAAKKTFPELWQHIYKTANATIDIPWEDGEGAPLSRDFWRLLAESLMQYKRPGNVTINCFGGHGRTGTALVALGHSANVIPSTEDAIKWIREKYCNRAVESKEQIDYLRGLGIMTSAKPCSQLVDVDAVTYGKAWGDLSKCYTCSRSLLVNERESGICTSCRQSVNRSYSQYDY